MANLPYDGSLTTQDHSVFRSLPPCLFKTVCNAFNVSSKTSISVKVKLNRYPSSNRKKDLQA